MNNKSKIVSALMVTAISFSLATSAIASKTQTKPATITPKVTAHPQDQTVYKEVNSLDVVVHPEKYLNKDIKIKGQFDKFSTLGLDYKPAYKSSEKFITILIKRDDVINHTVPLSEMKIFLPRDIAEKHIDLEEGDMIEFDGVMFSNALGDAWIEVKKFSILSKKNKDKK